MAIFERQEIYQFAMRIEENGKKFYRQTAQALKDKEARDLFNHLADEEVKHKRVFESLLSRMEKYDVIKYQRFWRRLRDRCRIVIQPGCSGFSG